MGEFKHGEFVLNSFGEPRIALYDNFPRNCGNQRLVPWTFDGVPGTPIFHGFKHTGINIFDSPLLHKMWEEIKKEIK